ncbi:MAG TPA: acyl-CoA dehydrogenase family protein [Thermoleophilaceae bacterium]|jgi:alkylation response protein AidB-like acyl-CoA dehydrogenase
MQLTWTDSQRELRDRFEQIGRAGAARSDACYDEGRLDTGTWDDVSRAGLWRIPVARADGGSGGSWWDLAAAVEGLARGSGDLGFLLSAIAHIGCVRVLALEGSAEQRATHLQSLLAGDVGSTAITEPTGGSDVAAIRTAAERARGRVVLSGHKAHITNAPVARVMVVLGRIPALGRRDITLFVLDTAAPGVVRLPAESMLGNRTSPTGDVLLQGVELGEEALVGAPGRGLELVYRLIAMDRVLYALVAAAYLEPIFERSLEHCHRRHAYGAQIADHQYVQQRLVDMRITIETSRSLAYRALGELIDGGPEASLLCSMAKLVGTEQLFRAAEDFVMLHGHRGYSEADIGRVLCDAAGTRIAGGTSDIQRKNIFSQLQRLHGYSGRRGGDRGETIHATHAPVRGGSHKSRLGADRQMRRHGREGVAR